jgi:glutathione synthase
VRPGSRCNILVVMDGLESIKPGMDSTAAIVGEAHARGHAVDVCRGEQLAVLDGTPVAPARPVTAMAADEVPVVGDERPRQPIGGYDAVLLRKNPPVDRQYFYETLILERLRGECLFMNDPRALREVNEKLAVLEFPQMTPRTLVTRDIPHLQAFLEECGGDIVVKPLDGYSGHGVLRVTATDQNRDALFEFATEEGTRLTMAQSYITGAEHGDKRILMLNGVPIAAFVRRPAPGLLRGNTRAGATLEPSGLTARDEEICTVVGPRLPELGLYFVGLDIVGGYLTEINVTSPGGIRELTKVTGERVEGLVVDWLERASAARERRARVEAPRVNAG